MPAVSPKHLVLSVTENGFGKRTRLAQYRLTARGGKGVINMKTTKKNGRVVSIMQVSPEDEVMIISRDGKIIRIDSDKIRATGRAAQGVRLVTMGAADQVAAAAVVPDSQTNGDDEADGANGQGTLIN